MTPLVRVRSVKPATDGEHAPADDAASGTGFLDFDDFYRQEYAAVVRLAFALTGRLGLAEEMAQDAFLSAMAIPHRNNPNRYVEVRGRARMEEDPDHAFIDALAHHYMGVDRYPFDRPGQERVTVTIVAEHVSAPDIPLADRPPQARDR